MASMGEIMAVAKEEVKWERVTATADSGASDTVGPQSIAMHIPVKSTRASIAGIGYIAANGSKISNYGEKRIAGISNEGVPMGMTMQVTDVQKVLAAVSQMCDAGNRVIFDNDGSYILNKKTGQRTAMRRERGVYKFDMWIEKKSNEEEGKVNNVECGSGNQQRNPSNIASNVSTMSCNQQRNHSCNTSNINSDVNKGIHHSNCNQSSFHRLDNQVM